MFLEAWNRRRRYQRLCEVIAPVITQASQLRVDKTLVDAYSKATAQGATPEDIHRFNQGLIDRTNQLLSKENAVRIHEWTSAMLDQETRAHNGNGADAILFIGLGFVVATLLWKR